jgi:CRP/FNR family cyclic AMP-dependent transcriptional regulator
MANSGHQDELQVPKGAVIFHQGDPGDEMFVVESGHVRLTLGTGSNEKEIMVLGPGDFFGELSLLSGMPRSATAQAIEDCALLVISRDVFAMIIQDDLDVVFRMMNAQGQRLSNTNQPIQQLMEQLGRVRIVCHCLRELLASRNQSECTVNLARLAADLGMQVTDVSATLAELAQHGTGQVRGHEWHIEGADAPRRLVDVLARYSEPPAE